MLLDDTAAEACLRVSSEVGPLLCVLIFTRTSEKIEECGMQGSLEALFHAPLSPVHSSARQSGVKAEHLEKGFTNFTCLPL